MHFSTQIRDIREENFSQQKSLPDKIRFVLQYAILAPSTHNTQPWLFEVTENSCRISIDSSRILPKADKSGRNLYISFGCMLENLIIAAKYFRIFDRIVYGTDANTIVAEVFFVDSKSPVDIRFAEYMGAIIKRTNSRGLFSPRSIPQEILREMKDLTMESDIHVHFITEQTKIERIAQLTAQGLKIAHGDSGFRKEMSQWINHNLSSRKFGMHGYSLGMPTLLSFVLPRLIRICNLGWLLAKLNMRSIISAPLICVLSSSVDNQRVWLSVGHLTERLMLLLAMRGLTASIFVAAIEMGGLSVELKKIIPTTDQPQFLFCAGYMPVGRRFSMRQPVAERIVER